MTHPDLQEREEVAIARVERIAFDCEEARGVGYSEDAEALTTVLASLETAHSELARLREALARADQLSLVARDVAAREAVAPQHQRDLRDAATAFDRARATLPTERSE